MDTRNKRRFGAAAAIVAIAAGLAVGLGRPGRRQAAAEAGLRTTLPRVDFAATPLSRAAAELGVAGDVPLMVDWAALEGAGFERSQPVDIHLSQVTVEQALIALLGYCSGGSGIELTYTLHEGAVVVTTVDQQGPYTYAAVYDVRDIPVRGPPPHTVNHGVAPPRNICFGGPADDEALTREEMDEEISSALTAAVSPDLWATAGGNGGSVQALSGRLVVVATWRQHHEIRRILSAFREPHPE